MEMIPVKVIQPLGDVFGGGVVTLSTGMLLSTGVVKFPVKLLLARVVRSWCTSGVTLAVILRGGSVVLAAGIELFTGVDLFAAGVEFIWPKMEFILAWNAVELTRRPVMLAGGLSARLRTERRDEPAVLWTTALR